MTELRRAHRIRLLLSCCLLLLTTPIPLLGWGEAGHRIVGPLHVSYADDRGGNDVQVKFLGKPFNLHSVWDTAFIKRRTGSDWVSLALQIRSKIPEEQLGEWRKEPEPEQWADESLTLTVKSVCGLLAENRELGRNSAPSKTRSLLG